MTQGGLVTHGIGGSTDLPIPLEYALVGGVWALTISFAVLALAWRQPRLQTESAQEPQPRRTALGLLGLAVTTWVLAALYLGPNDSTNGAMGAFYVLVWVGLVPLALLFGHVWRDLSPWRTVQAILSRGRADGLLQYPPRWGYWPAVLGIFAFVWLELASPDAGSVSAVRVWVGAYVAVMVVGGVVFGSTWFDRGDPFDVYSAVVARLSPFVADGRRRLHNPLRSLPTLPIGPGLVALLGALLGSTAFDSFSSSQWWQRQDVSVLEQSLALAGFCAAGGVLFWVAARATTSTDGQARATLPGLLAHSLVPIIVGYIFAHYLSYLVLRGQQALIALTDPLGRGWTPLGDLEASFWLNDRPELVAILKVVAVLAGHVVAVVAAHDKALDVLPASHRLTGQVAMLILMVAYTFGGLYLLFAV